MEIEVHKASEEEKKEAESWGTWEKEVSEFQWSYDEKETCLILEGEAEVEAEGRKVKFGPGDLVVFPKGLECTWRITKAIRKKYRFG